jgi:hypothetical protein
MQGLKDDKVAGWRPGEDATPGAMLASSTPVPGAEPAAAAPAAAPVAAKPKITLATATDEQLAKVRDKLDAMALAGDPTSKQRLAQVAAEIEARAAKTAAPTAEAETAAPAQDNTGGRLTMAQYEEMARTADTPEKQAGVLRASERVDTQIETLFDLWSDKPRQRASDRAKALFPVAPKRSAEEILGDIALDKARANEAQGRADERSALLDENKRLKSELANKAGADAKGTTAKTARDDLAAPLDRAQTEAETTGITDKNTRENAAAPGELAKTASETQENLANAAAMAIKAARLKARGAGGGKAKTQDDPNLLA